MSGTQHSYGMSTQTMIYLLPIIQAQHPRCQDKVDDYCESASPQLQLALWGVTVHMSEPRH